MVVAFASSAKKRTKREEYVVVCGSGGGPGDGGMANILIGKRQGSLEKKVGKVLEAGEEGRRQRGRKGKDWEWGCEGRPPEVDGDGGVWRKLAKKFLEEIDGERNKKIEVELGLGIVGSGYGSGK